MKRSPNKFVALYFALAFLLAWLTSCNKQTQGPQLVASSSCEAPASSCESGLLAAR